VTSADGQPIPSVQVFIRGTTLGTLTNATGRYRILNIPAGSHILQSQSIGFSPLEQPIVVVADSTLTVDFTLQSRSTVLGKVVVVGYGTQRKEEITGAVSSVTSEQFIAGPARDAGALIAGKIPGLSITTPSGNPTAGTEISLRGTTTIQGSRTPLILIDGIPGGLSSVPAPDIESITVLKDGSAAAVYGSRASNGVILVTTKRHSGGKPTIRYDGYTSYQTIYNAPDFLDAADYRRLIGEGYGFQDLGGNTDWQAAMLRNPLSYRHNVALSGGDANTNYTASVNYEATEGIFIRSDNKEITGRGNIRQSMFDGKLQADLNIVSRTQSNFEGPSFNNAWRQALIRNPTDRLKDDNGLWQERGTYMYTNPIGLIEEENGEAESRNTRMHGTVTFRPIDVFQISLMGGTTRASGLNGSATTFRHVNTTQSGLNGTASRGTSSSLDRILELTGSYDDSFGDHNIAVVGGYGYQDNVNENFSASNRGFPTDLFGYNSLGSGSGLTSGLAGIGSDKQSYKLIGFFSRVNYDWQNRFLLMGTVRYEGNSRFGADHKWGVFPGVSAGWRLTEESFMKGLPFDDLKLRAGYGVTGIAPGSSYLSLTSYNYGGRFYYNGQWVQGLSPARNPNPNLKWEEKHEVNVGLDFSMFESRLSGVFDVYRRDTKDMLYNYSVPVPPNLFGSILANVGNMRNEGMEAELTYDVLNGSTLRWTTSVNGSTNRNKLVSLSNDLYKTASGYTLGGTGEPIQQSTHRVDVGKKIGNFYGFKSVDIDDNGEWIVLDSLGVRIPIDDATDTDRRVLGNGIPKYYAGWNNSVRFRNFDFSANMRGAFGFQILNYQRMYYENPKILQYNMLKSAFDPVYGKRKADGSPRTVNYDLAYVSYYVEDGDYWKLDNATLGFTIPTSLLGRTSSVVNNARVYVSGRNLFSLTGYKGMDPEVSTSGLTPGQEQRDTYPTTRMFTFGMTVGF
jgi:TonB-linked SusC/RagA family outer membrane protein